MATESFSYLEMAKKFGMKPSTLYGISKNPEAKKKIEKYFIIKTKTGPKAAGDPVTFTLKKGFKLDNAVKDVQSSMGRTPIHTTPEQQLFVSQEVSKANAGEKYVTADEILDKTQKKFKTKLKSNIRTYPVLGWLDTRLDKADQVLRNMLMEKKPLNGYWNEVAAKRIGVNRLYFRRMLEQTQYNKKFPFAQKVPTYEAIKDQGADFISGKGGTGMSKTRGVYDFITKLSFSDQLAKGLEIQEGVPILKQIGSRANTPKMKAMQFAFRNWALNQGQGEVKLFNKKGKLIPYEYGKVFDAQDISFKYKGKMFSFRDRPYKINNLSDPTVLKTYFPEVEKITNEMNNFGQKKIANPFKKPFVMDEVTYKQGDKIMVRDLVKKIQVDGYGYKPSFGSLAVLHGPKGVKGEPFTNLIMNTSDINLAEASLGNALKSNKINKSEFNTASRILRGMFEGRTGPEYRQSIVDRLETQVKEIQKYKGKDTPFQIKGLFTKLVEYADKGGPICYPFRRTGAVGGLQGPGCGDEVRQALQDDPDKFIQEVSQQKVKPGESTGFRNVARQILNKIPKGGRIGALVAGAGAVGAGTWAMMGGAEAEETPTTEQMTYNSTTGEFDNAEGDPETQEGILNWIADNPIKSGLAAIPVGIGAGLGAEAMGAKQVGNFFKSMKFILPPAYAAEKLHQYKRGDDMGQMFANPIDAVWAMALDTPKSAAGKMDYYRNIAQKRVGIGPLAKGAVEAEKLGLRHLDPRKFKETGAALKRATMAPRSFGTSLVFPFAGPKAGAGAAMKVFRGALRLAPLGPLPMALLAGSMAWDKYKFNKKVGDHVDALRSQGVVSEEDAETMNTIYKQGWLGTTAIGAKILGSEELMLDGELADIGKQKEVLAKMKEFYEGREQKESYQRAGERQEDFFDWFSKGGRVGLAEGGNKKPFGSMTRRGFLKWLVGSIAMGVAAVTGKGIKQAAKTATTTTAKNIPTKFIGVEGMPAWFPRAVAKIKAHGKLIELADKKYIDGDIYEMMIPVKRTHSLSGRKGHTEIRTEMEKVTMSDNPLTGEINMHWTGTDNFGDDAIREINFKPGQAGYQKFGVDDPKGAAQGVTEYRRVKVEEPEFTYTQPDQSQPYRDDVEFLDIFEEGDEIVKGLEDMTGGKKMLAKDGSIIDVSAEGKGVDEAFQKKIFKDIEGEGQIIPDPEGVGVTKEGNVYGEEQFNEIIEGVIPDHLKKKASGGRVGFKHGGSWADWMSNHSDDMTFEEYLQMDIDKPIHPVNKNTGGVVETGNIARRPGAVPPLSGPNPQGTGIVGLFSNPKRVNVV